MIVEENASVTPTYPAVTTSIPNASATAKPATVLTATCPRPVSTATDPVVRIRCGSSRNPTRNSRIAIPSRASSSIVASPTTQPVPAGPTRIPTAMNATINGCRSRTATSPAIAAMPSTTATSENACNYMAPPHHDPGAT